MRKRKEAAGTKGSLPPSDMARSFKTTDRGGQANTLGFL